MYIILYSLKYYEIKEYREPSGGYWLSIIVVHNFSDN